MTLSAIPAQGIYCLNPCGLRNPGLALSLAEGFLRVAWRAKENPGLRGSSEKPLSCPAPNAPLRSSGSFHPQPLIYGWEGFQRSFTFMNNIFQNEKRFGLQLEGTCTCQNLLSWFTGKGKRKIGPLFSWLHCGIFKTSNEGIS